MGVLDGKAIVVTGAGRGLGAAYATLAAREGANVVVNDVDRAAAEQVATTIRAAGGTALARHADVSSWRAANALVQFCVDEFGALDGLVNNAGLYHLASPTEETEDRLRRIVEVNVLGTSFCGVHALRQMLKQGCGSLVNIASGSQAGSAASFAYGATKGAIASMTYCWAIDTAGTGVRVNAVAPVGATRMVEANAAYYRGQPQQLRRLKRGASSIAPASNAPLVVYLLSELSKNVHGQVIRMQGRSLTMMTHPAARHPWIERSRWTIRAVAEAFSNQLESQQLPLGVHAYELEVMAPVVVGASSSARSSTRRVKRRRVR